MAEIVKEIFKIDFEGDPKSVTDLADAVERLQQEVEAAKKSGQGLEEATKKLAVKQREFVQVTLQGTKARKDETKATNDQKKSTDENTKTTVKGANALKLLRNEIKAYKAAALEAGEETPVGQNFIRLAAEATDRMGDLNQSVLNLSKDTRSLDTVTEGARAFTSVLAVGQGVMAQFVGENKDLQEVLVKLQGTQAILSGLTEIQNALQKESALITGLQSAKRVILTGVTAGMTLGEIGATVATNVLNIAIKALLGPIGWIIGAIGLAAAAYSYFTGKSKEQSAQLAKDKEEIKKSAAYYKLLEDALDKALEKFIKYNDQKKKLAELRGASEKKLLDITLHGIDTEINSLNGLIKVRNKHLDLVGLVTRKEQAADKENQVTQDKIKDLQFAREVAILEFMKKNSEDKKKVQDDYNKFINELRKQLTASAINQIEDDRVREITELNNTFLDRISAIKNKSKEELELRKKLTKAQRKELDDTETALITSLTNEKNQKELELQQKWNIEDEKMELQHIETVMQIQGRTFGEKLTLLERERDQKIKIAEMEIKDEKQLSNEKLKIYLEYSQKVKDLIDQRRELEIHSVETELGLRQTSFLKKFDLIERERQLLREKAIEDIKNGKATAEELLKIDEDAAQKRRDLIFSVVDAVKGLADTTIQAGQDVLSAQIGEVDAQISNQQRKVEEASKIAASGNAELLQIEQKRLDELNKKKEKFVRQQQALAVIELIANSTIAVSKAATEPFPLNLIAITATLVALAAGIAKAKATAASAAFKDGVIDLQGPGTETSDSINARLSKRESVMTAAETKKYKPTLLAIRNRKINPDSLNKFATGQLVDRMLSIPLGTRESSMIDNSGVENRLMSVEETIKALPEQMGKYIQSQQLNITEKGLHHVVTSYENHRQEINKRAR